jgi:hypothetical protein
VNNSEFLESVKLEVALKRAGRTRDSKAEAQRRFELLNRKTSLEKISSSVRREVSLGSNARIRQLAANSWL